jgi:hypothetical protein
MAAIFAPFQAETEESDDESWDSSDEEFEMIISRESESTTEATIPSTAMEDGDGSSEI